jgi:hypothetical protein
MTTTLTLRIHIDSMKATESENVAKLNENISIMCSELEKDYFRIL